MSISDKINPKERDPDIELGQSSGNNASPRIIVDDLIKIYKTGKIEVVALRGLNCTFYPGEITVIMGPSGCGKTTLLNLIGGLDKPTSGKIIVDGENIISYNEKELERYRRDKIGYVFQFMNLIPELNAKENIDLPLILIGRPKSYREQRIKELLDLIGLGDRAEHHPDELSGGEQQRIALAVALANNPEIILCDEPTGELDSESKDNVLSLLKETIKKYPDKVMIIVTHDPELKKIADRLYFIRDGQISHEMTKEELNKFKKRDRENELDYTSEMGSGISSITRENIIQKLRELEYSIKTKIDELEKELR